MLAAEMNNQKVIDAYVNCHQIREAKIVSTDIIGDYQPDVIDDICNSKVESDSYDAVYCNAILEHSKSLRSSS